MHSSLVKPVTLVLGVVLVLIGLAGFFTGDMLLMFQVDVVHNTVHLVSGVLAIVAGTRGYSAARLFLIAFGVIYGLVAFLGITRGGDVLGYFMTNSADNYLHTLIAAVCLIVGFGTYEHEGR